MNWPKDFPLPRNPTKRIGTFETKEVIDAPKRAAIKGTNKVGPPHSPPHLYSARKTIPAMDQNAEKDTKIKTDNCFYLCLICLMTQAAGRAHLSTVVMFVVRCISSKDRGVWPTLSWVSSRSKNNCRAILVSYYTFWNYFTFLFFCLGFISFFFG